MNKDGERRADNRRLYVDVSETLGLDVRTGIQRVVREVTRANDIDRFDIVPVIAVGGRFHHLSPRGEQQLRSPDAVTYRPGKPAARTWKGRIARLLGRPAQPLVKYLRSRQSARQIDIALKPFASREPVRAAPGDRVVLADTYTLSSALRAGKRAKAQGATLVVLTYDLIPITHPELHDIGMVTHFNNTVPIGMALADAVLTISDWCVGELQRFGVTKPIGKFYLGYDLPSERQSTPTPAQWPEPLWAAPVFLMVGTIARSKGHAIAIDAFEQLWASGVDYRLLIIGRPGWEEALMQRIATHPELGRRLFVMHGLPDATLDEAFRRSRALIQGSRVEGFGLPLVEALARGLPVIASDIAVFREIVGDAVMFYSQPQADELARTIVRMEDERELFADRARAFSWISWGEARRQFAFEVDRLARISER